MPVKSLKGYRSVDTHKVEVLGRHWVEERRDIDLYNSSEAHRYKGGMLTANTRPWYNTTIKYMGGPHLPKYHLLLWKWPGVTVRRKRAINPYAAIVGTPPAETREVKATLEGRIVQRRMAPKP